MKFYFCFFLGMLIWLLVDGSVEKACKTKIVTTYEKITVYIVTAIIMTLIIGLPIGGILYLFS